MGLYDNWHGQRAHQNRDVKHPATPTSTYPRSLRDSSPGEDGEVTYHATKSYGTGHDMSQHGEGKPYKASLATPDEYRQNVYRNATGKEMPE